MEVISVNMVSLPSGTYFASLSRVVFGFYTRACRQISRDCDEFESNVVRKVRRYGMMPGSWNRMGDASPPPGSRTFSLPRTFTMKPQVHFDGAPGRGDGCIGGPGSCPRRSGRLSSAGKQRCFRARSVFGLSPPVAEEPLLPGQLSGWPVFILCLCARAPGQEIRPREIHRANTY